MSEVDVGEDPDLGTSEKELVVRVNKADSKATANSEIGSCTRSLLQREDFDVRDRRVVDETIVSVTGELPIGAVTLSGNPRNSDGYSPIVKELVNDDD